MPLDHDQSTAPGGASGAALTASAPHTTHQTTAGGADLPPHATPTAHIDALEFTITVPRAQELFAKHDRKVPEDRTMQHYCKTGHLTGRKITHLNEEGKTVTEWLIHEPSLLTYIRSQPVLKNEPGAGGASGAALTASASHAAQKPTQSGASGAALPPHAAQTPLQQLPIVTPAVTAATPETDRRLLDALVDNARLSAQVEAKDQIIMRLDDVIVDLKKDKEIYVEELRSNRGERSDTRSITERLLDTIRSLGTGGRGSPVQDRPIEAHIIHPDRQGV